MQVKYRLQLQKIMEEIYMSMDTASNPIQHALALHHPPEIPMAEKIGKYYPYQ